MKSSLNDGIFSLTKALAEELCPSVMKKMDMEDTKNNRDDVLALALNDLPARYVATTEGKQYAKLVDVYRTQYESDVLSALTRACIQVKKKPRTSVVEEDDK